MGQRTTSRRHSSLPLLTTGRSQLDLELATEPGGQAEWPPNGALITFVEGPSKGPVVDMASAKLHNAHTTKRASHRMWFHNVHTPLFFFRISHDYQSKFLFSDNFLM